MYNLLVLLLLSVAPAPTLQQSEYINQITVHNNLSLVNIVNGGEIGENWEGKTLTIKRDLTGKFISLTIKNNPPEQYTYFKLFRPFPVSYDNIENNDWVEMWQKIARIREDIYKEFLKDFKKNEEKSATFTSDKYSLESIQKIINTFLYLNNLYHYPEHFDVFEEVRESKFFDIRQTLKTPIYIKEN